MKRSAFKLICVCVLAMSAMSTMSAVPVQAQQPTGGQQNTSQQVAIRPQRETNRAVQVALNFFAFNAGIEDGIMGQRSRTAISEFQTLLGYPATGRLAEGELAVLLSAYEQVANPDEALALKLSQNLVTVREVLKAVKQGEPLGAEEVPEPAPVITLGPRSMRALCVNIQASSALDLVMAQFCNLRQLAMDQGDLLLETALNAQMIAPVVEECQNFTAGMQPQIERILTGESALLFAELAEWVDKAGISDEKLLRQAKTCLGVAYQNDEGAAALAALLVLSGTKNAIYIELLGHHITFGLGLDGVIDLTRAAEWYELALPNLPQEGVSLTAQNGVARARILLDVLNIIEAQE